MTGEKSTPAAIAVVADRSSPKWKPVLSELGWNHAMEMLKHYPIVVACAYDRERIRKRAPILIALPDANDIELAVQQVSDFLESGRLCNWIFACDGEVQSRALHRAELNGAPGGTA